MGDSSPGAAGSRARIRAAFPALASPIYRRFLLGSMIATIGGFANPVSLASLSLPPGSALA